MTSLLGHRASRAMRAVVIAVSCFAGSLFGAAATAASFTETVSGVPLAPGETFTFNRNLGGRFETWKYVYWLRAGLVSIHQRSFFDLHLIAGLSDTMLGVSTDPFEIKEFFTNAMATDQTLQGEASISGGAPSAIGPTIVTGGDTAMIGANVGTLDADGFYSLSRSVFNPDLVGAWWHVEVSSWWTFLTVQQGLLFKDHHRFLNFPFIRGEEFVVENIGNDDIVFDFQFDAAMVPVLEPIALLLSGLGALALAARNGRRSRALQAG